jgi:hypothetical protein
MKGSLRNLRNLWIKPLSLWYRRATPISQN